MALPIAAFAVGACSSSSTTAHGELRIAGNSRPAGFGQNNVALFHKITVLTFNLCTTSASRIAVESIVLNGAKGLKVVDWGARMYMSGLQGGQAGIATKLGYSHNPIDIPCSAPAGAAFAVTVERTGRGSGTERSFTIKFDGGTLKVPYGIALCPARCTDQELEAAGF